MVTFIEALLDGDPVDIHGDGLQTRTFTYVEDTVEGIYQALLRPESRSEVINVGGVETVTILELAERIQEKLDPERPLRASFTPYASMPGNYQDVRDRVPNTEKAQRLLGFEAQIDLDEGLDRTIAWHQNQRLVKQVATA
jgi:UDP-glucose 4-epimerase